MDGFAIDEVIVGRDLVRFFNHWEYPMSADAADTIQGIWIGTLASRGLGTIVKKILWRQKGSWRYQLVTNIDNH